MGAGSLAAIALSTLCALQLVPPSSQQSATNTETYTYPTTSYVYTCTPYYYTYCPYHYNYYYYGWYWYGYWGCYRRWYSGCYCVWANYAYYCYTAVGQSCTYVATATTATGTRCKSGWKNYPNCDVAICSPACTSDQSCTAPNTCQCLSQSGGICTNVPCSDQVNCYPGTCSSRSGLTCTCPLGFSGPNCLDLTYQPDIISCNVQIFGSPAGTEMVVGTATECTAIGLSPQTIWVGLNALTGAGQSALTKIQATWEVDYSNPIIMPGRASAPFIQNSPVSIGVTYSDYTVSFPGSAARIAPVVCLQTTTYLNVALQSIVKCPTQTKTWSDLGASQLLVHNATMSLTITATIGGQKSGAGAGQVGGNFNPQTFVSTPTSRIIQFRFDFKPPFQCLMTSNNCSVFPIFLNDTVSSSNKIQPTFAAWTDDGSGLSFFSALVYYLQPNAYNLLVNSGDPVCSSIYVDVTLNNFICNVPRAGVYSLELTATDRAGNTAKARKIFNYNDQPIMQETSAPLYVDGTNPDSNLQFITSLPTPQNGAPYFFTARWPGRFASTLQPNWLLPVQRLVTSPNVIDDVYGTLYGLRSTDALPNTTGLLAYEFGYSVDLVGGNGAQIPTDLAFIRVDVGTSYVFNVSQDLLAKDGATITLWLNAYNLTGDKYSTSSKVSIHRSRNDISISDAKFITHYLYQYNSSVQLNIISRIGGIRNITFDIWDDTVQASVMPSVAAQIITRDAPSSPNSGRKKRDLPNPCNSGDPTCYCIPLGQCYNITQQLVIDNCWVDRYTGHNLLVRYVMFTLSGYNISSSVPITIDSNVVCRPSDLSGGGIAGIVIACLVLLLLLIILLLMFTRWRQHKHPIPTRIRTMMKHAPVTHHTDNELYMAPSFDDINSRNNLKNNVTKANNERKIENEMAAKESRSELSNGAGSDTRGDPTRVSHKSVQVGKETLGEGRFAVVRKGTLQRGNQTITVAIKALKSGYTRSDVTLMEEKMALQSSIPSHVNLVNFLGSYKEDDAAGSAPSMLLDCCERPLTDWLDSLKKVDPAALESMLNFSTNIAQGMEHLHANNVIHRRLTAKNVLLANTPHGVVAKLSGFGPSRDDGNGGKSQAMVKVKWLAPETLESLKAAHPVYNEGTDAWSYAVTLWEMYSKGEAPYEKTKGSDLRKQLQGGYKLPCPLECSPELYNSVMMPCWNLTNAQRPSLDKVIRLLEEFRNGGKNLPSNYYGTDNLEGPAKTPLGYYSSKELDNGSYSGMGSRKGEYEEDSEAYQDAR